jgi:dTDP-glucose 4,6-dehydratase
VTSPVQRKSIDSSTLLVTGGCGFIGSTFVRQRVERGDTIIVLDALTYAGHEENLHGVDGPGQFELVRGDICDAALVDELCRRHQFDAIVNFAAESHVDRSIASPGAFIETNIRGVYVLLNAALAHARGRAGFRFLQVSTDEVYGSLGSEGYFTEATPLAPNSPYSSSKAAGDLLVRAWHHTYGLATITTNCSNNYGPRQYPEKLIPTMIACALAGKPLPVYGDGGNVRDWIHVEDHCAGISLALERGTPGETYCFGGNAERNNLQVVGAICAELDRLAPRPDGRPHESAITLVTDRLGHDRRYAIDDARARRELGFVRAYEDFAHGLAQTVRWYIDNQAWCTAVTARSGAAA